MSKTYITSTLRKQVFSDFKRLCAYCKTSEMYTGQQLFIDHIIPESKGGKTVRNNLCLACERCNSFKGERTHYNDLETNELIPLFNPRTDSWSDHFRWSDDETTMIGLTAIGRATINALKCNRPVIRGAREHWVSAGWHPPKD